MCSSSLLCYFDYYFYFYISPFTFNISVKFDRLESNNQPTYSRRKENTVNRTPLDNNIILRIFQ